ncbi:hypothetical protein AHAS_Ahas18G0168000 [Arachis hypogaea]
MAAMANLSYTMGATAATTLQAVQTLGQLVGNGNGNGEGDANDNAEGDGDSMGGASMTLVTFLKVHLPSFRGSTNPTESDNWFQAMERAQQAQHIPNNQYVEFATYQLREEAQHWWQVECHLLQLQSTDVPWNVFQAAFYKKYFPESAREAKEMELMQLKQSFLSVANYTSRFEELCRFSRDDIMTAVAPLEIRIFSDLVNKARVVKEYANTVASSRDTHKSNPSRKRHDYLEPRGQNFNRDGHAPQHLLSQGNFRRDNNAQFHYMKESRLCYACGLPGHLAKNCRRKKNQNMGQNQQSDRVVALDARDATGSDPLTRGKRMR